MVLLSGSRAIKHYYNDFREPKDWDFITDVPIKSEVPGQEFKCNPVITSYIQNIYGTNDIDSSNCVLFPSEILTLKASHVFWDKNWEKHLGDILFLIQKGHLIKKDLFYKLVEFWEGKFGKRVASDLTLSKEEFFDNKISEKYDHDALHIALSFPKHPAYLQVLKPGSEVEPSEEKFNKMPYAAKLRLVREEIYVMAYERRKSHDYVKAYSWMLKKFIMNHAPIWEVIFILDNIHELLIPEEDYVEKINSNMEIYDRARLSKSTL